MPALQWMATMYSRPCRSHCFAEAQNARTIGSGGAPWSSNGKVAQFEPNLEISYERSLHKLNTLYLRRRGVCDAREDIEARTAGRLRVHTCWRGVSLGSGRPLRSGCDTCEAGATAADGEPLLGTGHYCCELATRVLGRREVSHRFSPRGWQPHCYDVVRDIRQICRVARCAEAGYANYRGRLGAAPRSNPFPEKRFLF